MSIRDDAKRLRVRDDAIAGDLSAAPYLADPGTPCLVRRRRRSAPTRPRRASFFACSPVAVFGAETEGSPATLSPLTPIFYALNLGGTIPAQGTNVILSFVGNRWVFRYDA